MDLKYEYVPRLYDLREHIRNCEGKHTQQAIYSTFHDALTQVCFGCGKVRSTIKREERPECHYDNPRTSLDRPRPCDCGCGR